MLEVKQVPIEVTAYNTALGSAVATLAHRQGNYGGAVTKVTLEVTDAGDATLLQLRLFNEDLTTPLRTFEWSADPGADAALPAAGAHSILVVEDGGIRFAPGLDFKVGTDATDEDPLTATVTLEVEVGEVKVTIADAITVENP